MGTLQPHYFVAGDHILGRGTKHTSVVCILDGMAEEVCIEDAQTDGVEHDKATDLFTPGCIVSPHLLLYDPSATHTFYVRCTMNVSSLFMEATDLSRANTPHNIVDHLVDSLYDTIKRQENNRIMSFQPFLEERTSVFYDAAKAGTMDHFRMPSWRIHHSCHDVMAPEEENAADGMPDSPTMNHQAKIVWQHGPPLDLPKGDSNLLRPASPKEEPPILRSSKLNSDAPQVVLSEPPPIPMNLPGGVADEEDVGANHF
jgi:hypothetical protein